MHAIESILIFLIFSHMFIKDFFLFKSLYRLKKMNKKASPHDK